MKTKWLYMGIAALSLLLLVSLGSSQPVVILPGAVQPAAQPASPINVSKSDGKACVPALAECRPAVVAAGGNVFVVWAQDVGTGNSEIFFNKSTDGGKNFGTPTKVAETTGVSQQPAIALLGGTLFVAWSDNSKLSAINPEGDFEIFITKSTDGGGTWQWDAQNTFLNLSNNAGESKQPALGTGGAGVFVAWADNTRDPLLNPDGTTNVFLQASLDGGQSFLPKPVNVSTSTGFVLAERPALAVDGTTTPPTAFIVWQQGTGIREILFRQSAALASPLNVSRTATDDSREPAVAFQNIPATLGCPGGKKVLVVWTEAFAGTTQIFSNSAPDAGVSFCPPSFETPFNLSQMATSARVPAIVVDSKGELFLAWEADRDRFGGPPEILLRTTLDPFSPPRNLSQSPEKASKNPAVATDDTNTYVVWVEEVSPGKFEVFFTSVPIVRRGS